MKKSSPPLPLPDRPKPYVMAHRGNRVACPENTLAAFQYALDDGADILETDLRMTADREIVCIHDATVDRTTNGQGEVAGMSFKEIKRLSAFYGRTGFEGERVPALRELAHILPDSVVLAIELKSDDFLTDHAVQDLVAILDQSDIRKRTVALSFSLARLQSIRRYAPDILIGWITLSRPIPLPGVNLLGPLWPWLYLNPLYVWLAHRTGQVVCPLDPLPDKRLGYYRFLGCDAVLSDDPGTTLRALGRRP